MGNHRQATREQMMRTFIQGLALVALSAVYTLGANAEDSRAEPVIYVLAGALLNVESGKTLRDQAMIIIGDRISKIGSIPEVKRPSGSTLIDLSDFTVLPGLIDAHTHLNGNPNLHGYRALEVSAARTAIYGVIGAKATLMAGFTTVRNVGAAHYADVALRDAIEAGEIIGPRMKVSGPSLGMTGGHCDSNLLPPRFEQRSQGVADGPWAVRAKVRKNVKYGVDLIKFCATGGVLSKGTEVGAVQYTLEEMIALVDEAHAHGRKVAAHAHGTEGIKRAIRAGVDSVEHVSLIDEEGLLLATMAGTALVMDIYVDDYIIAQGELAGILPESLEKSRQVATNMRENLRRAHEAGANIVFGTDSGVYPHGDNAIQFSYMIRFGMSPLDAIRSSTLKAAVLLDMATDVGLIAPGYFADLIAVDGNPLLDITLLEDVQVVVKGGRVIKGLELR
jgi:imidazolonepropionase-like amidohydrolase